MIKTLYFLCIIAANIYLVLSQGPGVSAPYIDVTLKDGPKLADIAEETGHKFFTLAFILGSHAGCDPRWAAQIPLNDSDIIDQINKLYSMGGAVIVATGGAMGPYLEQMCGSVDELANAYLKIIDTVKTNHLDIDVEASVSFDTMNKALAKVQRERPEVTVDFTLMVQSEDYGLTPMFGFDLLKNAVKNGVRINVVNGMTMEFGSNNRWSDAVINTGESILMQMSMIWPNKSMHELKAMLGITPMIGRNFNGKIFETDHAKQLVEWANKNNIGLLSFWSANRDNGNCPNGAVQPKCSSIWQKNYEFINIFKNFYATERNYFRFNGTYFK